MLSDHFFAWRNNFDCQFWLPVLVHLDHLCPGPNSSWQLFHIPTTINCLSSVTIQSGNETTQCNSTKSCTVGLPFGEDEIQRLFVYTKLHNVLSCCHTHTCHIHQKQWEYSSYSCINCVEKFYDLMLTIRKCLLLCFTIGPFFSHGGGEQFCLPVLVHLDHLCPGPNSLWQPSFIYPQLINLLELTQFCYNSVWEWDHT